MNFKAKYLSVAVAAAFGAGVAPAHAITADNYAPGATTVDFYVSGSSAQRPTVEAFLRAGVCDMSGSTLDVYLVASNYRAYLCKPVAGLFSDTGITQIAFYY